MSDEEAAEQRKASRMRERAARTDADPRLLSFVRHLRRRLPGDPRYGDSLSTAGEEPVHVVARRMSSLAPAERPSVAQELGLSALQLWQAMSEASGRGRGNEDVAMLFTDLVGFSSWALEAGDAATIELLRDVGEIVESAVAAHEGVIVKRLGDGVMATFPAAPAAVHAALEMNDRLDGVEVAGYRPRMRAGVHCGRPRKLGSDYLGVDVNIAARVGEAADGGQVLVSEAAAGALDTEQLDLGKPKRLKASGAPRELRVRAASRR